MDNFVADRIYVDAAPERVFEALSSPHDMLIWLDADSAVIDLRPGGVFRSERSDGSSVGGVISRVEAPFRLEISEYHSEGADGRRGPMRVLFTVTPHGDGAWITVRQDDLDGQPDWKSFAEETRREWVRATVALKRHVEQI